MELNENAKVYVEVLVRFENNGVMIPKEITWEDGRKYAVDRVSEIRQAAAIKAGGQGDRYTIWMGGHSSYLFFERNASLSGVSIGRWFVERK